MLFSFEVQYFDQINKRELSIPIIIDLPQATIKDVRLNPFVIDLVNHPFIKAGIEKYPNHKTKLVVNIQPYSHQTIPNTATFFYCRYQESPGDYDFKTFGFKIFADIPMGFCFPQSEFVFTCRILYDAYELLFQSRRFVAASVIPNPQYGGSQADPIRLTDQLLILLGFSYENNTTIKGMSGVNCFIGKATDSFNMLTQVYIKREIVGYSLIIPDIAASKGYRLERFFYLQELQYLMNRELQATLCVTNLQIDSINQHIRDTKRLSEIISDIPVVIEDYDGLNESRKPTREQTIAYVAGHFNLSFDQAQTIMVMMHY